VVIQKLEAAPPSFFFPPLPKFEYVG